MLLRQMNVTSSAGYQSTEQANEPARPGQLSPIVQQARAATVSVQPQQHEVSAAQIHKERKLAESKRRQEVLLKTQEDYTDKPEGHARLARQEERAQMQEEELRMARIVQAEKTHWRAQQLQLQREEEAHIKEMYLTNLRLDRAEKERIAQEKEVFRKQALELKMKALKDAADAKAREAYAARQLQIEVEALVEREHHINEIERARLAVEDELAGAMRQEYLVAMERRQQIVAEEAQWKQFEVLEAQKQLEATLKRRAAQAEQYEQDKQRRMEIHRLQKERARLAEKKHPKQLLPHEEPIVNDVRQTLSAHDVEEKKTSGEDLRRAGKDAANDGQANVLAHVEDTASAQVKSGAGNATPAIESVDKRGNEPNDEPGRVEAGLCEVEDAALADEQSRESATGTQDAREAVDAAPVVSGDAEAAVSIPFVVNTVDAADEQGEPREPGMIKAPEDEGEHDATGTNAQEGVATAAPVVHDDEVIDDPADPAAQLAQLPESSAAVNGPAEALAFKTNDDNEDPNAANGDVNLSLADDHEDVQQPLMSDGFGSPASGPAECPSTTLDTVHSVDMAAVESEPKQQEVFSQPLNQPPVPQLISVHDAQVQGLHPFAHALYVKESSPAMEASLQAGDLLVDFGGITSSTPNCLLLIADKVKSSVNHDIELVVLRPEHEGFTREVISLRPRKWAGKGLLGCQLNPFKWAEDQNSEPEADTNSAPATSDEQAQEDDNTSLLLVFYNVASDSIADQVGVKNGDLLMKCGDFESVSDPSAVAQYLQAVRVQQHAVELDIQRWVPEEQQYQQFVLELPVLSTNEPLGCSLTTFAEYYSTSETSGVDVTAASNLSACMDCYYTTLATSVHAAALNGHVSCLEALYEASCQDEQATNAEDQSYRTSSSVLDWRDSDGRSPLFYACYAQQIETIAFLLAHMPPDEVFDPQTGADLYGDSPLHAATLSGSFEILNLLLESKFIAVDVVNATQLACAHLAPSFVVLELLGERFNADLLATDADGRMPLSHACLRNDIASVAYLCEKHPDFVDYADASGNTPLHLSAWLGLLDVIRILIKYLPPIALYMPNQDGANPLQIAQASGFNETALYLEECMAATNQDDDEYVA